MKLINYPQISGDLELEGTVKVACKTSLKRLILEGKM